MVTGWSPDGPLEITGPSGRETIDPDGLILATGCRERPRSARLVPGSRPEGVMTTGTLQQLVYLKQREVGERALIVGAEHVSFSALATLAHAGATAVGMTTELRGHQTLALFRAGTALRWRTPLWTRTAVTAIHGRPRVEGVELTELDTGATRTIECDTVVFTADWIPDHELAVMGGLRMDPGTRGPVVDAALRTSREGVFAAGNLLHGAEPADVAALSGRHAAAAVAEYVRGSAWPDERVPIECEPPLQWIVPNALCAPAGTRARGRPRAALPAPLARAPLRAASRDLPGRTRHLGRPPSAVRAGTLHEAPTAWTAAVEPGAGPVSVRVVHRG